MTVSCQCPRCGKIVNIEVNPDRYDKYIHGKLLAQDAFSELSPEIREMLISGICPECWNEIFVYEEDD